MRLYRDGLCETPLALRPDVALSARMRRVPEVVGRCDQKAKRGEDSDFYLKSLYREGMKASEGKQSRRESCLLWCGKGASAVLGAASQQRAQCWSRARGGEHVGSSASAACSSAE